MQNGVFVDIGAHDGITFSNSYLLEKYYNWSGLLIEPQRKYQRSLNVNRSSTIIPTCAFNETGVFSFVEISESMKTSNVSGGADMLSGLLASYSDDWHNWTKKIKKGFETNVKVIEVACFNIQSLLDEYSVADIDYMSVDTEGSEMAIIKAIDFGRISMRVVHIECVYYDNRVEAYNFFSRLGYKGVQLGHDMSFFKPPP